MQIRKSKARHVNNKKPLLTGFVAPALALLSLMGIATYALLGPTGVLAWADYNSAINQRKIELAKLRDERDALKNKVRLLERGNVDPDLAGELMRKELNVVAPDEIVVPLN
ncbi:septum formation initiator [Sphingorhabdus lutea]|uniref:Septum formation initiator n=1 Tax=Sphingorhabdus lutea TaxID=1913578 RepID=A0A1L3JC71_9SPHN|nr:septum formation initiator family protein [Sphingorhabdus lutea]APG62735.1 septum formation initiator [Sphingorhabdus lutea]